MPRKILPPLDWQIGEDEPKAEGLKNLKVLQQAHVRLISAE